MAISTAPTTSSTPPGTPSASPIMRASTAIDPIWASNLRCLRLFTTRPVGWVALSRSCSTRRRGTSSGGSLRGDHYQIPNTPDLQDAGIRDVQVEKDDLLGFQWNHTFSDGLLFSLSPYWHFNQAHYISGPGDMPLILDDNNKSNYIGARAFVQFQKKQ